jgi:hypothetical protein
MPSKIKFVNIIYLSITSAIYSLTNKFKRAISSVELFVGFLKPRMGRIIPSLRLALGVWKLHNFKAAKGYFLFSISCKDKYLDE